MDFVGVITRIGEKRKVWKNEVELIEFVVEEQEGQYPDSLCFTLYGEEKVWVINGFTVGDYVEVGYNARVRSYDEKRFNSINAWRMSKSEGQIQNEQEMKQAESADDDLPF